MITLKDRCTPQQIVKLKAVGIYTIYDVITYFPYKIDIIKPLERWHESDTSSTLYIADAILLDFGRIPGKSFIPLTFEVNGTIMTFNLFAVAKFTMNTLKKHAEYQLLLRRSNGFWNLEEYSIKSGKQSTYYKLGDVKIGSYLVPRYSKRDILTSRFFETVHSRLNTEDYIINVEGLIPPTSSIPPVFSLASIHHPTSQMAYEEAYHTFVRLRVFLKLALMRYVSEKTLQHTMTYPTLNIRFLRSLTESLSYQLTTTQKQTIWDVLTEMTDAAHIENTAPTD